MRRGLLAVIAVVLLVGACSGDDASDPTTSSSASSTSPVEPTTTSTSTTPATSVDPTTTASSAPSTSQPTTTPATRTPAAIETVLQGLLGRYDEAVTTILTDPRVTSDSASPAVTAYLALFAPDSTFAQGALTSWAQDAAEGRSYRPGPSGSMINSTLMDVTVASDTEAAFTVCAANSMQVIDAAGNVIESSGGVTFVNATAVQVDGEWLLRDLSQSSGDCPEPGTDT
jgi:hypothetical protein